MAVSVVGKSSIVGTGLLCVVGVGVDVPKRGTAGCC